MKGMQYILRGKGFFYGWVLFSIPVVDCSVPALVLGMIFNTHKAWWHPI